MPWKICSIQKAAFPPNTPFNSATAVMPWKMVTAQVANFPCVCPLQFGHGGDAVENAVAGRRQAIAWCFNSATAVMPWKPAIGRSRASRCWLQFGHGGDAVEN